MIAGALNLSPPAPHRDSARRSGAYAKYWRGEALSDDEAAALSVAPNIRPLSGTLAIPDVALGGVAVHRPALLAVVDRLAVDLEALGLSATAAWGVLADYCRRGRLVTLDSEISALDAVEAASPLPM